MGDGQVSQGDMVVKPNATKVRKLADGRVLAGYAGSTADALTLMERLEGKLEEHDGASRRGRQRLRRLGVISKKRLAICFCPRLAQTRAVASPP